MHLARFDGPERLAPATPFPRTAWERLTKLREEAAVILEEARRDKVIGSSLEGAIALFGTTPSRPTGRRPGPAAQGLADLFIVSETVEGADAALRRGWRDSQAYPGVRIGFRKARGRRCDRCWKVTPEAEATGLCERCRAVLGDDGVNGPAVVARVDDLPGRLPRGVARRPVPRPVDRRASSPARWTCTSRRPIIPNLFDLTYVRNSGAAFGLFASVDSSLKAILLNSVAVIVFLIVSAYALRSSHKSVRLQVGLALILGGAVGNLLDRVRFGYVVDFLDFAISGPPLAGVQRRRLGDLHRRRPPLPRHAPA